MSVGYWSWVQEECAGVGRGEGDYVEGWCGKKETKKAVMQIGSGNCDTKRRTTRFRSERGGKGQKVLRARRGGEVRQSERKREF